MIRLAVCLLIVSTASGCALFRSPGERQAREYARYVRESRRGQSERAAAFRQAGATGIPGPQETDPSPATVSVY